MDYKLTVDRQQLLRGIEMFKYGLRKLPRPGRAILGFDGRYLTIEAESVATHVAAEGVWPGNANVSTSLVAALIKIPPPDDPIVVTCDGVTLRFGPIKVGCKWQPVSAALLESTGVEDWIHAIGLSYTQTRGQLLAAGKVEVIDSAERKLATLVGKVATSLAPLGVTAADVEDLVRRRLEQRYIEPP